MKLLFGALLVCLISGINGQSTPNQGQITCFRDILTDKPDSAEVIAFNATCSTIDLADSVLLCNSACLPALAAIYDQCGYDINKPCSYIPTSSQATCIEARLASDGDFSTCVNVTIGTFLDTHSRRNLGSICRSNVCRTEVEEAYAECENFDPSFDTLCRNIPSAVEEVCINTKLAERNDDHISICGRVLDEFEVSSLLLLCKKDCLGFFKEIYTSCDFDADFVQLCGGAVKVLAVPLLVLAFALFSVLF